MTLTTALGILNYQLVTIFGLYLSVHIAGGFTTRAQKRLIIILCPLLLLIQTLCWLFLGFSATKQLYPLIVHLPLLLILIFALKKPAGIALISVCTAYLCCQPPRWIDLAVSTVTHIPLAGKISYTLVLFLFYLLLRRYFVRVAYSTIANSSPPSSLPLFGTLPVTCYFYNYATVVYSDALSEGIQALNELLPTALIIFYVVFLTAYSRQMQIKADAELQRSLLAAELKQAEAEVNSMRNMELQVAVYQHDMRHHLIAINGFLNADQPEKATEYIQKVQSDVDAITPLRFCENELVNLLCSSFVQKANACGIRLTVDATLPNSLPFPDTELCSLLSNGLENALHAVESLDKSAQWVELYCGIRSDKLLIEIKNPYSGQITIQDGLPVSNQNVHGHGYGCRSIRSITEHHQGMCRFEPQNSIFILRVILPMK